MTMVKRSVSELGDAWENARANIRSEMDKEWGYDYLNGEKVRTVINATRRWWRKLYGSKLRIKMLDKYGTMCPDSSYVEFKSNYDLVHFLIRWL